MNPKGTKKKNQVVTTNIFEEQELLKKAEVIRKNLTASTWHELETNGKFDKNAKLSFISDDMLILGCDVGSETHYLRAIDTRGRELSVGKMDAFHSQFQLNGDPVEIIPNDWTPDFLGEDRIQRKKRIAYETILKYIG